MGRRAALVLLVAALLGCGRTVSSGSEEIVLMLDFTPNAAHAGIFTARDRGFADGEGVRLRVRVPGQAGDSVRLLAAGRVDAAVLDIHDLALARERGTDLVGIMALVQRPLAAVIARPGVRSPRELEGERVGVTGLPSDEAVLRSVVRGAGGDPRRVEPTRIGFGAVRALLAGRVAAATAFWTVEGVALRAREPGVRIFRVDEFGAPAYPELVVCVRRATLRERRGALDGLVRSLRRGYEQVFTDPESSAADVARAARGLDERRVLAELDAVAPLFDPPRAPVGTLDRRRLEAWARWEARFGIVAEPPDVDRAFALGPS